MTRLLRATSRTGATTTAMDERLTVGESRRVRRAWAALLVVAMLVSCGSPARTTGKPGVTPTAHVDPRSVAAEIEDRLTTHFRNSATGAYDNVRAVLVTVGGQPVVVRYFHSAPDAGADVFSVTKSVVSILIGIALDEGAIDSVDQTLEDLLPTYADDMAASARTVTLRQVLTMTAGMPPEAADLAPDAWRTTEDWTRTILADGPDATAGSFSYSNAGSHLLSVVLTEATGRSTLDYAREKLFGPLGIDTHNAGEPRWDDSDAAYDEAYGQAAFAWPRDPRGYQIGSCCIKMTAPDMAKLGELMLNDGRWGDTQIVSAEWVTESTRPQVPASGVTDRYGYQWWATEADGHPAFAAVGVGGQLIEVVPELDLVVVVSSIHEPGNAEGGALIEVVSHVVAPPLRDSR
jgi:CubicO group peptidase (beta-lactamase class C family)